jgi:protein-disulfide isomerase
MKRLLPFIIILVVLAVALGSAWYLTRPIQSTTTPYPGSHGRNARSHTRAAACRNQGIPGAEPAYTLGPATAPVHIEEFGDFECPPCGMFHPILKQMMRSLATSLHNLPRVSACADSPARARRLRQAAEAAGLQGKFWPMHDLIYDRQNAWKEQVRRAARSLRVTRRDRNRRRTLQARRRQRSGRAENFQDGKRAHSMGVKGTPTVFMNGREVPFESLPAEQIPRRNPAGASERLRRNS